MAAVLPRRTAARLTVVWTQEARLAWSVGHETGQATGALTDLGRQAHRLAAQVEQLIGGTATGSDVRIIQSLHNAASQQQAGVGALERLADSATASPTTSPPRPKPPNAQNALPDTNKEAGDLFP